MDVLTLHKKDLSPEQIKFLENFGVNAIWVQLEDPDFNPLHWEEKGDWIDLKLAEDVKLVKDQYYEANMGLAAKIHAGYEAHIEPRSSTYKRYSILMANEMGIVDNSYCGAKDIWHFPMLAVKDTEIAKGTRIAQFRLMPNMKTMFWGRPFPKGHPYIAEDTLFAYIFGFIDLTKYDIVIVYTDDLGDTNRGGLGSTGI